MLARYFVLAVERHKARQLQADGIACLRVADLGRQDCEQDSHIAFLEQSPFLLGLVVLPDELLKHGRKHPYRLPDDLFRTAVEEAFQSLQLLQCIHTFSVVFD